MFYRKLSRVLGTVFCFYGDFVKERNLDKLLKIWPTIGTQGPCRAKKGVEMSRVSSKLTAIIDDFRVEERSDESGSQIMTQHPSKDGWRTNIVALKDLLEQVSAQARSRRPFSFTAPENLKFDRARVSYEFTQGDCENMLTVLVQRGQPMVFFSHKREITASTQLSISTASGRTPSSDQLAQVMPRVLTSLGCILSPDTQPVQVVDSKEEVPK